jgi:hypothetical protein
MNFVKVLIPMLCEVSLIISKVRTRAAKIIAMLEKEGKRPGRYDGTVQKKGNQVQCGVKNLGS